MKILTLPYVAVIVIANNKPPILRFPKKYSCKKVSDERTDFPAHKPIIKITIKIPITGSNACPFMNARPLHHQKKHGRRIFSQRTIQVHSSQPTQAHNYQKTNLPNPK